MATACSPGRSDTKHVLQYIPPRIRARPYGLQVPKNSLLAFCGKPGSVGSIPKLIQPARDVKLDPPLCLDIARGSRHDLLDEVRGQRVDVQHAPVAVCTHLVVPSRVRPLLLRGALQRLPRRFLLSLLLCPFEHVFGKGLQRVGERFKSGGLSRSIFGLAAKSMVSSARSSRSCDTCTPSRKIDPAAAPFAAPTQNSDLSSWSRRMPTACVHSNTQPSVMTDDEPKTSRVNGPDASARPPFPQPSRVERIFVEIPVFG